MMLNLLKEFVEVYHRNKGLGELVLLVTVSMSKSQICLVN